MSQDASNRVEGTVRGIASGCDALKKGSLNHRVTTIKSSARVALATILAVHWRNCGGGGGGGRGLTKANVSMTRVSGVQKLSKKG